MVCPKKEKIVYEGKGDKSGIKQHRAKLENETLHIMISHEN